MRTCQEKQLTGLQQLGWIFEPVGFGLVSRMPSFDVRVTYPKADVLTEQEVERQLENNEREKKRQYTAMVNNVDRGTFTPLVFSTTGMVGAECRRFLKCLVGLIMERNIDLRYSSVMSHLRGRLRFCLLRWNITCLRGCCAFYCRHRSHSFVNECRLLTN